MLFLSIRVPARLLRRESSENARRPTAVCRSGPLSVCHALLIRRIILALVLVTIGAVRSFGGKISGTVVNTLSGKPLSGVMVEIDGIARTTFTDSLGYYSFDSVPSGSWNLMFFHEGSEPFSRNDVYVAGSGEMLVEAALSPRMHTLDKIVVRGRAFQRSPDLSSSSKIMNFDEILRSPGALLDVQRAVQDLPSVASGGDNTNEIIVRGGNPGENLLIMDNIEIPNPNHFADQGSGGGVISLINPMLVKGLTFSAGAPPAQYGGKASSVLDVKLREGNNRMVLGGIDLGMGGAGFHAEGPLWPGATFMASGTKSFLDLVARFEKTTAIPRYWGVQAKATSKFDKHKVYANGIYGNNGIVIGGARDEVGSDGDKIEAGGNIYATGVSLESSWSDRFSTTATVSGVGNSFDRFEYTESVAAGVPVRDSFFVNRSVEQEQMLKVQGSLTLGKGARLIAGTSAKRSDFNIRIWERPDTLREYSYFYDSGLARETDSVTGSTLVLDNTGGPVIYKSNTVADEVAYKYNAWLSSVITPVERVRIVPGVRIDGFTYTGSRTVSPRLGTVIALTPDLDLTGSVGVQYQDPDYAELAASPQNRSLEPKRAVSGIVGTEYLYARFAAKFIIESFYKRYDFLAVNSALLTPPPLDRSDVLESIGSGRSYGIELFAQKKLTGDFFWTCAYSLSRSEYRDLRPGHEGEWYRGDFDFRNAFTFTGGYKTELIGYDWYKKIQNEWWMIALSPIMPIADRIEISAKWRFLGGRPRTAPSWDRLHRRWVFDQEQLNASSFDDYHRLDLRFERRFGFGFLQMIYYFDLQNIYNKDNIWNYMYSDIHKEAKPIYQFHFFPAGGIIIGF